MCSERLKRIPSSAKVAVAAAASAPGADEPWHGGGGVSTTYAAESDAPRTLWRSGAMHWFNHL